MPETSAFLSRLGHGEALGELLCIFILSSVKWKNGLGCFPPNGPFVLDIVRSWTWERWVQVFHYWFLSLVLWCRSRIYLVWVSSWIKHSFLYWLLTLTVRPICPLFGPEWYLIILASFLQNSAQFWSTEGKCNLFCGMIDYVIACRYQPAEGSMQSGSNPLFFSCSLITTQHSDSVTSNDFSPKSVVQLLAFVGGLRLP